MLIVPNNIEEGAKIIT